MRSPSMISLMYWPSSVYALEEHRHHADPPHRNEPRWERRGSLKRILRRG